MYRHPVRCLALHTGGAHWVDAVAVAGPPSMSLLAWRPGDAPFELGVGPTELARQLMAEPGRPLPGIVWLAAEVAAGAPGPVPGESAGLCLAAAAALAARGWGRVGVRVGEGAAWGSDPTRRVLAASGRVSFTPGEPTGVPAVAPVGGWPEKLRALAAVAAAHPAVDLACPAEQAAEVAALASGLGLAVRVCPVAGREDLWAHLVGLGPDPGGWDRFDPALRRVLGEALGRARVAGHGTFGVEHVEALLPPWALAPAPAQPGAWDRPPAAADPPVQTPRLARILGGLGPGAGVGALASALASERGGPAGLARHGWGEAPPLTARRDTTLYAERPRATVLEVCGGPEDGRLLPLTPGSVIGRATTAAPDGLYARFDAAVDPRLSRRHLRCVGDARIEALAPMEVLHRDDRVRLAPGDQHVLRSGDLLRLSGATRLWAPWPDAPRGGATGGG